MPIKKIDISGLRGFANSTSLSLALPNGKNGSGITILVGANNGGKSTVVEAFRALTMSSNLSFSEDKRNMSTDYRLEIVAEDDKGNKLTLKTVEGGGSEIIRTLEGKFQDDIFVLPSRRYFMPFFGKGDTSKMDYINRISSVNI